MGRFRPPRVREVLTPRVRGARAASADADTPTTPTPCGQGIDEGVDTAPGPPKVVDGEDEESTLVLPRDTGTTRQDPRGLGVRVRSPELITQARETHEVAAWPSNTVDMGTSQNVATEDMEEKGEIAKENETQIPLVAKPKGSAIN
ncbi:hypothetical protein FB451DRAFT_1180541 [Mycena latifolia]|nr:hypothetical protein FB451DRAFT_1180541 [Mycena latifolia]